MTKERQVDVYWFKKVVKYLTEHRSWSMKDVANECKLNHLTIKKILEATKDDDLQVKASTWAQIQTFNDRWKVNADATVGTLDEIADTTEEIVKEYRQNGNGEEKKADPVPALNHYDEFDLMRELSKRENVNMEISLQVTVKK